MKPHTAREVSSAPLVRLPPWAQVSPDRRAHIERVANLVDTWAKEIRPPASVRDRWLRAVNLHDALKDAPNPELQELSDDPWGIPELRHGPAAAVMAARHGERDRGVLDAVRFHSVGFPDWDSVGKILYLADGLEPGRTHSGPAETELALRVPHDVNGVLRIVVAKRLQYMAQSGMRLLPETVDFWNSLVCLG